MLRVYLTIGLCVALIGAGFWLDHRGYERGKAACEADRTQKVEEVQEAIDLRDTRTAQTRVDMLDLLRVTIPPIEIRTHETITKIRTVYRDNPLPAGACVRSPGVREAIDSSRDRANAATRGLRLGAAGPDTANPGTGQHGRVGGQHDGDIRASRADGGRNEQMLG